MSKFLGWPIRCWRSCCYHRPCLRCSHHCLSSSVNSKFGYGLDCTELIFNQFVAGICRICVWSQRTFLGLKFFTVVLGHVWGSWHTCGPAPGSGALSPPFCTSKLFSVRCLEEFEGPGRLSSVAFLLFRPGRSVKNAYGPKSVCSCVFLASRLSQAISLSDCCTAQPFVDIFIIIWASSFNQKSILLSEY